MTRKQKANQKKLLKYRYHKECYESLVDEVNELRERMSSVTADYSFVPHGNSFSGKDGLWADSLDKIEEYVVKMSKLVSIQYKKLLEILNAVDTLEDPYERTVIILKYIRGLRIWEIADKLGYSDRQLYRIEGKALEHIRFDK